MRFNRSYIFIAVTSVALLTVLIIQLNWIINSAQMKESLFNEKAKLVLSSTAEAITSDKEAIRNLQIRVSPGEVQKIDSLFNQYMLLYDISIDYTFEVRPAPVAIANYTGLQTMNSPGGQSSFMTCIGDSKENGLLELKLVFPEKSKYIRAEMGTPFFTSVILIVVVLVLSWRTVLSLSKEKMLSEKTRDFLNNMTHEFKTPMTNIALAGKMVQKEPNIRQEEKIRHFADIILEENEKLRLQVEQVLSMTALERGEIPLRKTDNDIHRLIHESQERLGLLIENTGASIQLNLQAQKVIVFGDRIHLTNTFCNLIENAIKYSTGKPQITIDTSSAGPKMVITVSDKGKGIAREHQKMVFEKYYRVPTGAIHDVRGFGLGLAYVKTILELHGGEINLESETGEGTTFTITLPYG